MRLWRPCKQVGKDAAYQGAAGLRGNISSSVIRARKQQKWKGVASGDPDSLRPLLCPARTLPGLGSTHPSPQSPTYYHREMTSQLPQLGEKEADRLMCPPPSLREAPKVTLWIWYTKEEKS